MDVKVINPFITATLNVLDTMAMTKAKAENLYIKQDEVATGDVTAVIGLSGDTRGTVSVSFSEECALAIVSKMLGEQISSLNEDIKDAVGEIGNMISGQARVKLEELGRVLYAAVPTVVTGKNHSINHITTYPIVAIPFVTDDGSFTIEVCFEE
ncbi:chemotaxis protein CheX [Desulfatibacillum aliphaticivorans]|uniref:Inhibitor CheX (Inhibitor of MCP methylation protein CheC) n=1 Tax=Desulfatibacillum aliphaticivorans TaxID=218208 RepID=B8F8X2_DESAL|nr:chemotaxis protein CheX [Desulfatibacillum aliphaticivorans]ACL02004.1 Inhibitor CheX (inhibitor of MCP methylation protein CheC) [Desulfatibacillum aliphaticivorans]